MLDTLKPKTAGVELGLQLLDTRVKELEETLNATIASSAPMPTEQPPGLAVVQNGSGAKGSGDNRSYEEDPRMHELGHSLSSSISHMEDGIQALGGQIQMDLPRLEAQHADVTARLDAARDANQSLVNLVDNMRHQIQQHDDSLVIIKNDMQNFKDKTNDDGIRMGQYLSDVGSSIKRHEDNTNGDVMRVAQYISDISNSLKKQEDTFLNTYSKLTFDVDSRIQKCESLLSVPLRKPDIGGSPILAHTHVEPDNGIRGNHESCSGPGDAAAPAAPPAAQSSWPMPAAQPAAAPAPGQWLDHQSLAAPAIQQRADGASPGFLAPHHDHYATYANPFDLGKWALGKTPPPPPGLTQFNGRREKFETFHDRIRDYCGSINPGVESIA